MARDTRKLHPDLQVIIPKFLKACHDKGYEVRVTECYRTIAEQNAIVKAGNSKCAGNTYSSPHQWGIAFDICRNDGKGAYYDTDGWFTKVGKLGETFGLQWGGDWKSFVDKPHFQLAKFFDKRETVEYIKSKYKNPSAFMKTWGKSTVTENWGNLSASALKKKLATLNKTTTTTAKPSTTSTAKFVKGDKIVLKNANLYVSATAKTSACKKTGTYFIYDNTVSNGRMRITNKLANCGKAPTGIYVTGWITL